MDRKESIVDALTSGNRDALVEVLDRTKKEDRRLVGGIAVKHNCYGVIKLLIREGWSLDLDELLRYAIVFGENGLETAEELCLLGAGELSDYWERCSSLEAVEELCLQGAGELSDYWETCSRLKHRVAFYEVLLKHNVVTPRMLFCERGDMSTNVFLRQQFLIFTLDLSRDHCWKRRSWFVVPKTEHDEVLGLVKLYARNGARIAVRPSLLEELPEAGPRVAALMAAALQPASLQSLCRKVVRRVGPKRKFKSWVLELGLPGPLSDYLCSVGA